MIVGGVQERTHPIDEVKKAYGAPVWYQLYASQDVAMTMQTVKRIESAGCPVLVWTVDILGGRNLETVQRFRRLDKRNCSSCHDTEPVQVGRGGSAGRNTLTFDTLKRLKDATSMKIVVKGIENGEDADLCVKNGADGIIVSNHGGRATETGAARSTSCRKSSSGDGTACRSSSTAGSAEARTSSRRWRSARAPSASGGPICGASRRSAQPGVEG